MRKIVGLLVVALGLLEPASIARAADMTWPIENRAPYEVEVQFYSRDRDALWPGVNRVWYVHPGQMIQPTLRCQDGEYICYGAWPTGNSRTFWGVGRGGKQGCSSCCYNCLHGRVNGHHLNPN
jgi:hypothetical protein